jgi:WD40 repeat protein
MSVQETSQGVAKTGETDPGGTAAGRSPKGRGAWPYQGLAPFEEADEPRFFGREDITELLAFLAEQRSVLPLMLVGGSGAGKSSLLRAGLLPRLRAAAAGSGGGVVCVDLAAGGVAGLTELVGEAVRAAAQAAGQAGSHARGQAAGQDAPAGGWDLTGTTRAWDLTGAAEAGGPGGEPVGGTPRAGRDDGAALVPAALVVDHAEAMFTLCQNETERAALVSALCELARGTLVVLALRADFYGRVIGYPGLLRALQERQVVLGPMTEEQLRRAITEPARLAGADVPGDLVETVLADLALGAAGAGRRGAADRAVEAGALPLLSYAMLAAWRGGADQTVTLADYAAAGGVRDALSNCAERVYQGLSGAQRRLARLLLPRLVQLTDGLPPTRVTVPLTELRGSATDAAARVADADRVLAAFAGEGLLTVEAGGARLAHDAVLTAWPRLRAWIEEDAEAARARRRLAEDQQAVRELEAGLAAKAGKPAPPAKPVKPVRAGKPGPAGKGTAPEQFTRRRVRRLRGAVAVLTVLVLAAAGLTAYAFNLRQRAVTAEQSAAAGRQAADSRAVAFAAAQAAGSDPAAAGQLAASAYAISATPQATGALLDASAAAPVARITGSAGPVQAVSVSPDGRLLIAAGRDGSLQLWNTAAAGSPALVATLAPAAAGRALYTAVFSPDGSVIAAAGQGQTVQLWQVTGSAAAPAARPLGQPLTGPQGSVNSVAFSPDGRLLAAGSTDGRVRLWRLADPASPAPDGKALDLPRGNGFVTAVAFSARGVLAAGTSAGTVVLWQVPGAAAPVRYPHMPVTGPGGPVTGIAFSPAGTTLAASSQDHQVWLWTLRAAAKHKPAAAVPDGTLTGGSKATSAVAFSPDGQSVAAGTVGGNIIVWRLATRAVTASVPQPQPVTALSWAGADRLAAADTGGTVSLISLPAPVLAMGNSPGSVSYSPDGTTVAIGGASLQLWSAGSRTLLAAHPIAAGVRVTATAFSHRGVIAAALSDGTVALLNGRTLAPVAAPFPVTSRAGAASAVAFSASGDLLAAGASDGSVRLYNVSDPARPLRAATADGSASSVSALAFAPDGALVATAAADGTVRLWAVSGGALTLAGTVSGGAAGGPTALAFSPGGGSLAVGSAGDTVRLWNVADPARPVPLGAPLTGPSGAVRSAAFSPDGAALAAGAADGTVWLWKVTSPADPALTATLTATAGDVTGVAFAPSGDQLAAADEGTVHLFATSAAAAAAAVCGNLGQPLTPAQWSGYVPGAAYRAPCPAG